MHLFFGVSAKKCRGKHSWSNDSSSSNTTSSSSLTPVMLGSAGRVASAGAMFAHNSGGSGSGPGNVSVRLSEDQAFF